MLLRTNDHVISHSNDHNYIILKKITVFQVSAVALECISQTSVDIAFSFIVESGFHIDPMICYKKEKPFKDFRQNVNCSGLFHCANSFIDFETRFFFDNNLSVSLFPHVVCFKLSLTMFNPVTSPLLRLVIQVPRDSSWHFRK